MLEESLAITRSLGDRLGTARSLYYLGRLASSHGDHCVARSHLVESLAIRQETGDRHGIAITLSALAVDSSRRRFGMNRSVPWRKRGVPGGYGRAGSYTLCPLCPC